VKTKSISDYSLFVEAWIYLSLSKLLIVFFPFKKIASLIGEPQVETVKEVIDLTIINDIEISMIRAIKYTIFSSKCYEQALAITFMLKRRRISSTIYFGLYKESEQLLAHAWVRCGDKIVTGKLRHEKFTPVAWFGSYNLI
jgi:hypothetical protein